MTFTVPLIINNELITGSGPTNTFPITNPATSETIWHATSATAANADQAVAAAAAAYPTWRATSTPTRSDHILKAALALEASTTELSTAMMAETGCTPDWCAFNIANTANMLRGIAARVISGVLDGALPESAVPEIITTMVTKVPYGVVLSIAPWNAALILGIRAILYPLAAGNTVVFKGSELSPQSHFLVARLFSHLPAGVLNFVTHTREDASIITTRLIANPSVRKVNFTGSTPIGRIVAATAGQYLKPCTLELGGKAPMIVCADADLAAAAVAAAFGAMHHAGQICMSTEKILVHASVVAEFTALFRTAVANAYGESQVLINAASAARVGALTNITSKVGNGGGSNGGGGGGSGSDASFPNTILTDISHSNPLWQTESFGPVVLVNSFIDEVEAVRQANDTEFGLNAAVWTRDMARGLKLAAGIDAGAVHVNGATVHDEVALLHGGVKGSGWGRFGANGGIEEFLTRKVVTFRS